MFKWVIIAVTFFCLGFIGYSLIRSLSSDPNSNPETILSLSTNNLNPSVDENFDIALNIQTSSNTVSEALISINYDKNLAKFVSLEPASGFSIDSESVETEGTGLEFRIKAIGGYTGSSTIARIRMKSLASGSLVIVYGNRTIVGAASDRGQNVLVETLPIEINIK